MKRLYIRACVGFPLGICCGYLLMLLYSDLSGSSAFVSALPFFKVLRTNELDATILQTLVSGMIGSGSVSIITLWETPLWSNQKTIVLHALFCIVLLSSTALLLSLLPPDPVVWLVMLVVLGCFLFGLYRYLLKKTRKHVAYLNIQLTKLEKRGNSYDS